LLSSNKIKGEIIFEKIIGDIRQIKILYGLLNKKTFGISHITCPKKKDHREFVLNNPYRSWYLIKVNSEYYGSTYILKNNCIGISILNQDEYLIKQTLCYLQRKYKPLREIKSLRPPYFYVNIAPDNKKFMKTLKKIGASAIQITYSLRKEK